uniref:Ig-like domain-containing protein n=1 Tax=Seriola lalandi dorsalis TaxID=1841481 RepID=A0A3B4YMT1_SERLL
LNLCLLLITALFVFSGCTDEQIVGSKTVCVGDNVTLTCARKGSGSLFWIRTVSGKVPQVLGKTYSLESVDPRIEATEERETFVLSIKKAKLSDTAVYYCMKIHQQKLIFLNGTDLRVKGKHNVFFFLNFTGSQPDVTAVPTSDPVHPGDSETLRCSVLFDSEKKTCPGDHSVYCFRAESHEFHLTLLYAHGQDGDICEKTLEAQLTQKCVYNFSKSISFSDAGTHYCAVVMCGEILFGNGTKLDVEGNCRTFLHCGEITIFIHLIENPCKSMNLSLSSTWTFCLFSLCCSGYYTLAFFSLLYTKTLLRGK